MLAGPAALIARGRRLRKMLGGGMRQAGVVAAPGLLALRDGPGFLAADHARARSLAAALSAIPGVLVVREDELEMEMLSCVLVNYIFMCGQEAYAMPLLVVRENIDVGNLHSIDILHVST